MRSHVRPALDEISIVSVTGSSIGLKLVMNNTHYVSLDSDRPSNITLKMRPNTFRDMETKTYFVNEINLQMYQLPRLIDGE